MHATTYTLSHEARRAAAAVARRDRCCGITTIREHARRDARAAMGRQALTAAQASEVEGLIERAARGPATVTFAARPTATLEQRLRARLVRLYEAEIQRRGGEVEIEQDHRPGIGLSITDRAGGLCLLGAEGWRYYSRRFGSRPAALCYLAGRDDNGPWAVRVPGTVSTVDAALAWIEPAAVRGARAAGRRVLRQGDVYAIECRQDRALTDARLLPASHRWDAEARVLYHEDPARPHAPLAVPFPCRLVRQRVYAMGRTARRAGGD